MACIFCKKFSHVPEGTDIIDIEPLNPVVPGHRIIFHRKHTKNFAEDLDVTAQVVKYVSLMSQKNLDQDVNVITSMGPNATQTVPHLHVHSIPIKGYGLHLPWTGQTPLHAPPTTSTKDAIGDALEDALEDTTTPQVESSDDIGVFPPYLVPNLQPLIPEVDENQESGRCVDVVRSILDGTAVPIVQGTRYGIAKSEIKRGDLALTIKENGKDVVYPVDEDTAAEAYKAYVDVVRSKFYIKAISPPKNEAGEEPPKDTGLIQHVKKILKEKYGSPSSPPPPPPIPEEDIKLVMDHAQVSRDKAMEAIRCNDHDLVHAIMELTM